MSGIPGPSALTEDSAESLLSSARANAQQSLKDAAPDSEFEPVSSGSSGFRGSITLPASPANDQPLPTEPPPDAIDASTVMPPEPPPDAVDVAIKPAPKLFEGAPAEVGNGIMRGFAALGRTMGFASAVPAVAIDKVHGMISGGDKTGAQDAVFDFLKNYVDSAYDNWHAEGETGKGAQVLGHVAEIVPALATGPAAPVLLPAQSMIEAGKESIDEGQDVKTAAMVGTAAALATYAGMKVIPTGGMLKRLAAGAGINVGLSEAQQRLTRRILSNRGYKEAAARIDPNDPQTLGEAGLIGAIFGVLAPKGGPKKGANAPEAGAADVAPLVAEPPPDATDTSVPLPPPAVTPPLAVPGDVQVSAGGQTATSQKSPQAGTPSAEAPVIAPVVDRASAEPLPDLQAQIADLDNPKTPRRGVYLSPDNVKALGPQGVEQLAGGRPVLENFDDKGGVMIAKDAVGRANALTIKEMAAANPDIVGPDPIQYAIGKLTDAGTGKHPDQTAVIQGQTPEGAVASESMVRPDEVPARVAQMQAEGKTPVITTPVDAIARREGFTVADHQQVERRRRQQDNAFKRRASDRAQNGSPAATAKTTPEVPQPKKPVEGAAVRERGVVKTGAGERAVFIEGEAKDGKVPVRIIDEEGNPSEQVVHVPEASFVGRAGRNTTSAPAEVSSFSNPAKENSEVSVTATPAKKPVAEKPQIEVIPPSDTPPTAENNRSIKTLGKEEGGRRLIGAILGSRAAGAEGPSGRAPAKEVTKAIGEQLADAADMLRTQETPPAGKKFPAPLKERAMNVANFARALKAAAIASDASPEIKARAISAAKAVERVDLKSDEAIAKNQGVGHSELSTHAENLLNAAELLRNPDANVGEIKAPKAEKLKVRIAKVRTLAERQAGVKPHLEKVVVDEAGKVKRVVKEEPKVKVIEDVPDETKPRELTKGEQLKLKAVGKRMVEAKDEDLDARRTDVEALLHEIYGDKMDPDDRAALMYSIEAERRDRTRRKSRDEEIDEEFADQRFEREKPEDDGEYLLERNDTASGPVWNALAKRMTDSGTMKNMVEAAKAGHGYPGRKVIDHMAAHLKHGAMRDFLTKLSAHLPEETFIRPVTEVTSTGKPSAAGGGMGGLFTYDNQIQVRVGQEPARFMQAIVHEAVHAATVHIVRTEPNNVFVREIGRLRDIAERRMRAMYGDDLVSQHLDFYKTGANKPAQYSSDFYALHNSKEFMSEVMTNPVLQEVLAKSERYKAPDEGFISGVHNLARAIFDVVKRMLGLDDKEGRLLEAAMRTTEDVMEAQKRMFSQREDVMGMQDDQEVLRSIERDDQRPLRGEGVIRSIAGDRAAFTARQFYRTTRAGVVRAMRKTVLANETHDQIVRSNAHWFGSPDDAANPLRQYDAAQSEKAEITNRVLGKAREAVTARQRLTRAEDKKLGQFQIDATLWGIDPTKAKDKQTASVVAEKKFESRWAEFQRRWANLSTDAKDVFTGERDFNEWSAKQNRKAAIDAALDTFSDKDVSSAQRQLLYSVRNKVEYDSIIGAGKLIDVGDRNKGLVDSLTDLAGLMQREGPYFHLGRHGEYVVQINPEGSKDFGSKAEADAYATQVREMGPGNKAKVAELAGKWNVSTKIQHVSMHENSYQAEQEAAALRAAGYEVGKVTQKVLSKDNAPLSSGIQQLVGEATRKLEKHGSGDDTKAMSDALRATFVTMTAARSAYAASKLARRGFAGVKGEEMGRNFAAHAQSMAWNTGNLATVFKSGEALGRVREAAKNPDQDVSQAAVYKRGAVMDEIGKRMQQEVSQYGLGSSPLNAAVSKLGFLNFLASPAHAAVNMTQNFTTAIPVAVAKYGTRAVGSFARSMRVVGGPSFRAAMQAHLPGNFSAEDIAKAVVKAVGNDPAMGKWVKGGQLQQLMDRGVISSTFAHEIATMSKRQSNFTDRVFDYSRILPQMAEVYNRVSTALAGLELTGGDVAKTADFVHETHLDYSQGNKSRVFKSFARIPGGNAVLMFKTYVQGMAHLLYGNVKQMVMAETKSRAEAAKTVAALILAQSIFAGVVKGALLEPLRLGVYAYNKLFGDDDEYFSLENSTRRAISSMVGKGKMSDAISGGLPRLAGVDLSTRMGFSDLFLHNPPDLLAADTKQWMEFAGTQLGPMPQMVAQQKENVMNAIERGSTFDALVSLVPVKAVQDMNRAFDLYQHGKRNTAGGQLTKPSGYDAAIQALGFKPATVAKVQERTGTAYDLRNFQNARQKRIIDSAGKTGLNQSVWAKVNAYNKANPGNPITVQDFIKQYRSARRAEAAARGGPERDPKVRKLLDY